MHTHSQYTDKKIFDQKWHFHFYITFRVTTEARIKKKLLLPR